MALTRAQGFPKIESRPDGGLEIRDCKYDATGLDYNGFKSALTADGIEIGSPMADIETTALLMQRNIRAGDLVAAQWYADLVYGTVGSTQWILENSEFHRPIEQRTAVNGATAFLQKWRYALAAVDVSSSNPSWYAAATSDEITDQEDQDLWRWVRDGESTPVGWGIKNKAAKRGYETFIDGMMGLRGSTRYPSFDKTAGWTQPNVISEDWVVGTRVDLTDIKPYLGSSVFTMANWGAAYWLVTENSFQPDGLYWLWTVRLRYSPEGWDTEVYGAI